MSDIKIFFLTHYKRYPSMQIEDFVKLIFQMIFGPKHFLSSPNKDEVVKFLYSELQEIKTVNSNQMMETIGDQYYRIYLDSICNNQISVELLSEIFYESMICDVKNEDQLKFEFVDCIHVLLSLIQEKKIDLPYEFSREWLRKYLEKGIVHIGHSSIYKECYHPHYRVISKSILMHYFSMEEYHASLSHIFKNVV